jgi:hypothetical protein
MRTRTSVAGMFGVASGYPAALPWASPLCSVTGEDFEEIEHRGPFCVPLREGMGLALERFMAWL